MKTIYIWESVKNAGMWITSWENDNVETFLWPSLRMAVSFAQEQGAEKMSLHVVGGNWLEIMVRDIENNEGEPP